MPLAKIIRERGWSETTAARNSQVYCISDELLNTPAPTLLAGLRALAAAIHPLAIHPLAILPLAIHPPATRPPEASGHIPVTLGLRSITEDSRR